MKMTSALIALRVVDILEGRATIDEVEPFIKNDVMEALSVYTQGRGVPKIDTLPDDPDQPNPDSNDEAPKPLVDTTIPPTTTTTTQQTQPLREDDSDATVA